MSLNRRALENSIRLLAKADAERPETRRGTGFVLMSLFQTKLRLARLDSAYYEHVDVMLQELVRYEASAWLNNAAVRSCYTARQHLPSWDAMLKHSHNLHSQTEPGLFAGLEEEINRINKD